MYWPIDYVTELELAIQVCFNHLSGVDAATVYYLTRWVVYHDVQRQSLFQCLLKTVTFVHRSSHASCQAVSYMWCNGNPTLLLTLLLR
jgi:hypothetical protein